MALQPGGTAAPPPDPQRWAVLSPRLDRLLQHDAAGRSALLATWRSTDPALADELQALLQLAEHNARDGFLEGRALPTMPPLAQAMAAHAAPHAIPGMPGQPPRPAGAAPDAATAGLAGQAFGPWTLQHPLGEGGMGSVWLARRNDGRHDGQAAIKMPHPALLGRGGADRFAREGKLLARLAHPRIAALLDAGVAPDGQPYLVLEYVRGEPIDRWCDAHGAGIERRIALVQEVLEAVSHAHAQLVLHRDLKPANILVTDDGHVKLLDFGIAKLLHEHAGGDNAQTTQLAFTPDHAAPEQLQGEPVGTATDVYALGVLLYQLLGARHPTAQPTQTPVQRLRAVVEDEPPRLSDAVRHAPPQAADARGLTPARWQRLLRGDLERIVGRALKKRPVERYPSATALADDLRRWREGLPVSAQPDTLRYRGAKFVRRHRVGVAASVALALAILAGVAGTAWQTIEARRERDAAQWQAERALAGGSLFNLMLGEMGALDQPLTQRQVLERAVRLVERTYAASQPRIAVELLLPIAGQYYTLGDTHADLAVMQRAAALAQASGDAELVASVACSTVDTLAVQRRLPEAEAELNRARQAIQASPSPPSPKLLGQCDGAEAQLARRLGDTPRALQAVQRAIGHMQRGGGLRGNIYPSLLSLQVILQRADGDTPAAFRTLARLGKVRQDGGSDKTLEALADQHNHALLLIDAGELPAAAAQLEQVLLRWPAMTAVLRPEAVPRPEAAASAGSTDGTALPPPRMLLNAAQLQLNLARWALAGRLLEATRQSAQALNSAEFDTALREARARLALAENRGGEARVLAGDRPAGPLEAALLLAEGQAPRARQVIEQELQRLHATGNRHPELVGDARRLATRIALAEGDAAGAATHAQALLLQAERSAREREHSAWVGDARLWQAQAQAARGDAAAAAMLAGEAVAPLVNGLGDQHPRVAQARGMAGPRAAGSGR